jgi:hypothetical protein
VLREAQKGVAFSAVWVRGYKPQEIFEILPAKILHFGAFSIRIGINFVV